MGKSGSAKTLTSLAVRDTLMKCVTMEFSYITLVFRASWLRPPSALYDGSVG